MRQGEGVVSYPGGHQDVGIWKGLKLVKLKFAVKEMTLDPLPIQQLSRSGRLHTPDLKSRGPYGPKGCLEVCEGYTAAIKKCCNGVLVIPYHMYMYSGF